MYDYEPEYDDAGCRVGSVRKAGIVAIAILGCAALTVVAAAGLPGWVQGAAVLATVGVLALVLR